MNSSISNSESAPYWPPSRNVLLILLLLAVWMAAVVLVDYLDPFPPEDPVLSGASAALGENTHMLAMGTSHVLYGINPAVLGPDTMNIAMAGADYETLFLILRHRLPDMPNLQFVLLEADNLSLFNTGLDRRDFSAIYAWGLTRKDLPLSRKAHWRQVVIEHPLVAPFLFSKRLTPAAWVRGIPNDRLRIGPGFQIYTGRMSSHNDGKNRILAHELTMSDSSAERNIKALTEMLRLLKQHGVRVVMMTLPHDDGYSANASARWNEYFRDILEVARNELGDEMEWWNYDRDPAFTDEDFNDGHHLNGQGAEKFSRLLQKRIAERTTFPSLDR